MQCKECKDITLPLTKDFVYWECSCFKNNQPERLNPKVQDFDNGWHRQDTKEHICIWSDKWLENAKNQNLKCDSPIPENK